MDRLIRHFRANENMESCGRNGERIRTVRKGPATGLCKGRGAQGPGPGVPRAEHPPSRPLFPRGRACLHSRGSVRRRLESASVHLSRAITTPACPAFHSEGVSVSPAWASLPSEPEPEDSWAPSGSDHAGCPRELECPAGVLPTQVRSGAGREARAAEGLLGSQGGSPCRGWGRPGWAPCSLPLPAPGHTGSRHGPFPAL